STTILSDDGKPRSDGTAMMDALRAVWGNKTLWAIHVVANAALVTAIYGWLSIPDRTVLDLMVSAVAGLGILFLASCLHGGTFEYFRLLGETGAGRTRSAIRLSFRRICIFAVWLLVLCAAVVLVLQLRYHLDGVSNWVASALTFRLCRPVRPASVSSI